MSDLDLRFTIEEGFKRCFLKLDTARSLSDVTSYDNKIKDTIKSFWVARCSKPTIDVGMRLNPANDQGASLPLRENMRLNLPKICPGAAFEWPAQPGDWVEIFYSPTIDLDVGQILRTQVIMLNDGAGYGHALAAPTSVAAELIAYETSRRVEIYNKGTVSVYIGPQVCAQDADYKNLCIEMPPGSSKEYSNNSALWARTETTVGKMLLAKHQY